MLRPLHYGILNLLAGTLVLGAAFVRFAFRSAPWWQDHVWFASYIGVLLVFTLQWVGTSDPRWPPRPGARTYLAITGALGLALCVFLLLFHIFMPSRPA